jgi:hypothetical protein
MEPQWGSLSLLEITGSRSPGSTLLKHFGVPAGNIATASRQFPITARVDIQSALDEMLRNRPGTTLLGILWQNPHEAPSLAQVLGEVQHFPINSGPIQHDEIDIGEAVPVRCLKNGLWLSREKDQLEWPPAKRELRCPRICFAISNCW